MREGVDTGNGYRVGVAVFEITTKLTLAHIRFSENFQQFRFRFAQVLSGVLRGIYKLSMLSSMLTLT